MDNLVSVIITTKNSVRTVRKLLESLKNQSYKEIEIILVDNNSEDNTVKIASEYTDKIYQRGPERSAQRNFGAKKANGKYLLFLDSDMVIKKNVLTECIEKIKGKNENLGGVVIPEKSFGRGIWAKSKAFERQINIGQSFFESARFIPSNIFFEFGGFDEEITGPEDWDLPQRIAKKFKMGRIKSIILHNEGRLSLVTLFRKKYYYGLSAHIYLKKQKLPVVGPATIYFLRPAFYKNWQVLLKKPILSASMIIMLTAELLGGGFGYIKGRIKYE